MIRLSEGRYLFGDKSTQIFVRVSRILSHTAFGSVFCLITFLSHVNSSTTRSPIRWKALSITSLLLVFTMVAQESVVIVHGLEECGDFVFEIGLCNNLQILHLLVHHPHTQTKLACSRRVADGALVCLPLCLNVTCR